MSAASVPGRRSRAYLSALARMQGQGEGTPFYRHMPAYDPYNTGAVINVPEESAAATAPMIPSTPARAPMPASGPIQHSTACGCGRCQTESKASMAVGVSG
jgi:hypothetical protein